MAISNKNADNDSKKSAVIIHNRKELSAFIDSLSLKGEGKDHSATIAKVKLSDFDVEPGIESIIPANYALLYTAFPLMMHDNNLVIAIADSADSYEGLKNLEFISGHHVEAVIADSNELTMMIDRHYSPEEMLGVVKTIDIDAIQNQPSIDDLRRQIDDKPLVELVRRIIYEAVKRNASDIHIKPSETKATAALRINGNMVPVNAFDKRYLPPVISRFKIIGGMNIAEHRLPQDGGAKINVNDRVVEMRMSIMPTIYGESLVVRLLQTDKTLYSFNDLHFSNTELDIMLKALHQSSGLIIACGPTGSGKSTSLYALLQEIKKDPTINIITVEDPVEFHIDGIEQIQIHRKAGFTFATALRNILRHDPDVIMIGEIRDEETAKMAIECALTGHLVLTTLHSIDSISSITRLLEMGVQPYLLKATLNAVIAQRLAKLNCKNCLAPDTSILAERLSADESLKHIAWKKGIGCPECRNTGLQGRRGIFEVLQVDKHLSHAIRAGVTEEKLEDAVDEQHMESLASKAKKMAEDGEISAVEYIRLKIN